MTQYRVTYQTGEYAGASRGVAEGAFSSNTYNRYETVVTAFGPNQARDMVVNMNGGACRCIVLSVWNA